MGVKADDVYALLIDARRAGATRVTLEGVGTFDFGPTEAPAPAEPSPADAKAMDDALKQLGAEAPSAEDLLEWSLPGPLPSERQREGAEPPEGERG